MGVPKPRAPSGRCTTGIGLLESRLSQPPRHRNGKNLSLQPVSRTSGCMGGSGRQTAVFPASCAPLISQISHNEIRRAGSCRSDLAHRITSPCAGFPDRDFALFVRGPLSLCPMTQGGGRALPRHRNATNHEPRTTDNGPKTKTATPQQIAANRRNAQKSTGPKTPEGKDRVRFNALKHGMTASTVVLPHEDPDAFLQRMAAWKASYQPQDDIEDYLVDRAVTASWLLDRSDHITTAHIASHIRNAAPQQTPQQLGAGAALGRRLMNSIGSASTTEHPEALVHELEGSAVGCHWLLGHWHDLRRILDHNRTWSTTEKLLALALLGKEVS